MVMQMVLVATREGRFGVGRFGLDYLRLFAPAR